ncbi:hypothetical protein BGZ76_007246 [Entomortierella beljakovae]|nr:hypothetical protein BGZ76_007246 [Entomortierella beljakovae]
MLSPKAMSYKQSTKSLATSSSTLNYPIPKSPLALKNACQRPSALSFSHISSTSSTVTSMAYDPNNLNASYDHTLERQKHLRQNQEIIRICALKSTQIRQSEARLLQLENENLELRAELQQAKQQVNMTTLTPSIRISSPSPQSNQALTPLERLKRTLDGTRNKNTGEISNKMGQNVEDYSQLDDQHDNDQNVCQEPRIKKARTNSSHSSNLAFNQSLLSKLDQIQIVYQHEHEALCAMMDSFNSTTRLYKDLISLVEQKSFDPIAFDDDMESTETDSSLKHLIYQPYIEQGDSRYKISAMDPINSCSRVEEQFMERMASTAAPSVFSSDRRNVQKSDQRHKMAQVEIADSPDNFAKNQKSISSDSNMCGSGITADSTTSGFNCVMETNNMSKDEHNVVPPMKVRTTQSINTLPSIGEQEDVLVSSQRLETPPSILARSRAYLSKPSPGRMRSEDIQMQETLALSPEGRLTALTPCASKQRDSVSSRIAKPKNIKSMRMRAVKLTNKIPEISMDDASIDPLDDNNYVSISSKSNSDNREIDISTPMGCKSKTVENIRMQVTPNSLMNVISERQKSSITSNQPKHQPRRLDQGVSKIITGLSRSGITDEQSAVNMANISSLPSPSLLSPQRSPRTPKLDLFKKQFLKRRPVAVTMPYSKTRGFTRVSKDNSTTSIREDETSNGIKGKYNGSGIPAKTRPGKGVIMYRLPNISR